MKMTIKRITILVSIIAGILLVASSIYLWKFMIWPTDEKLRIEYFKFALDI